jgi:hypothetical protein
MKNGMSFLIYEGVSVVICRMYDFDKKGTMNFEGVHTFSLCWIYVFYL